MMPFFQPELGWSMWASLGRTKITSGLNWRMLDRLAEMGPRHVDLLLVLKTAFPCTKHGGRGSAGASPVASPMPKSFSS